MASVNVNTDVADQFYRYKMPKIIAKVEGKGNGIKTVIVNMTDVAKALSRPPTYPTKFFGCELGAQTQFDIKNDRYIVNGSHDASKLQGLLDGFIKRFVLCMECSNPETVLNISQKNQSIKARCRACGHAAAIDMRHKLTTFILKNPPDVDPTMVTPKKKDKKEKRGKKPVNGEKEDDRASPETNQQQSANQRATGGDIDAPPKQDDDDDWADIGEDFSDEAVIKRKMELITHKAQSMVLTDDLEKTYAERMDIFYGYIKNKLTNRTLAGADQDILAEAERLEIKDKCVLVLVELLMDDRVLQQIKQHRKLLLRFCLNEPKVQKYLLGGVEQLVGNVHKDVLMPKVPHILKLFYDSDIVEEDVLIEWGKKVSKKFVSKAVAQEIHEKAAPFITWLAEAEEEEDSDEGAGGAVEVAFSTTGAVGTHDVAPPSPPSPDQGGGAVEENGDAGDDIDIDAI